MAPTDRLKLCPDIMIVNVTNQEAAILEAGQTNSVKGQGQCEQTTRVLTASQSKSYDIKVVEIGYGSDTRYIEKLQEKAQQHSQLCKLLKEEGVEGHKVEFYLSYSGHKAASSNASQSINILKHPNTNTKGSAKKVVRSLCQHTPQNCQIKKIPGGSQETSGQCPVGHPAPRHRGYL